MIGLAVIRKMQIPRFARNDNSRGFRRALRLCLMDSGLPSFAVHSQEWLCHWSERLYAWTSSRRFSLGRALTDLPAFFWASLKS